MFFPVGIVQVHTTMTIQIRGLTDLIPENQSVVRNMYLNIVDSVSKGSICGAFTLGKKSGRQLASDLQYIIDRNSAFGNPVIVQGEVDFLSWCIHSD